MRCCNYGRIKKILRQINQCHYKIGTYFEGYIGASGVHCNYQGQVSSYESSLDDSYFDSARSKLYKYFRRSRF